MGFGKWGFCLCLFFVLTAPFCTGITDDRDVLTLNSLYVSMGFPPLLGWNAIGGDPCGEEWQGVLCVFSNVTSLTLSNMNLGGVLGSTLGFASILSMDFSNNHIGGSIPLDLPLTVKNFSLSGNQLTGNIPSSLSTLTLLSDLSLSNNLLSGAIPDAFQQLTSLINLDVSNNNLTNQLPPSMASLLSLQTLNLQNNKLTGLLDVLQDLELTNLNVENNLFSGPIPDKLLSIPNFRKDRNPFNTSIILAPTPSPLAASPLPADAPEKQANPPFAPDFTNYSKTKKFWITGKLILVAVSVVVVILILLALFLGCRKSKRRERTAKQHDVEAFKNPSDNSKDNNSSSFQPNRKLDKLPREPILKPVDEYGLDSRKNVSSFKVKDNMAAVSLPVNEKELDVTEPTILPNLSAGSSSLSSIPVFTIASLQQYTNSFAEDNLIGEGTLGKVYRAELSHGQALAVKKLDSTVSGKLSDGEFVQLVSCISKLKHANIVELLGYCNEHGQKLLVYEYCSNGTLYDALHNDDDLHQKLSWNTRIKVALGAARALQYLHEVCQPPVVHQNFKSTNILLDDRLVVHASDCGLAPLMLPGSVTQLPGYSASEIEMGNYTSQSDVYSLGVIMLELLTGRKCHDRSRPRLEQSLVRWAMSQLHDIDALANMVDPSLNGAYPVKSLSRFADIISRCVQWESGFRPPISEVVQDLLRMI